MPYQAIRDSFIHSFIHLFAQSVQ